MFGKHFIIYMYCQDPTQNVHDVFSAFRKRTLSEWKLVSSNDWDSFINAKGDSLKRYWDDHERSVRGWFLQIFQHGGSDRFTFGAIEDLKTIFYSVPPLLGRPDVGDPEVLMPWGITKEEFDELSIESQSAHRILSEVINQTHDFTSPLGSDGDSPSVRGRFSEFCGFVDYHITNVEQLVLVLTQKTVAHTNTKKTSTITTDTSQLQIITGNVQYTYRNSCQFW